MKQSLLLWRGVACALSITTFLYAPAEAQQQTAEHLKHAAEEITALIDAENSKSELCKAYVGKTVQIASFDALAQRLPSPAEKGEFETTAQYEARRAAAVKIAPSELGVFSLPTDREYLRYDADRGFLIISAGTFNPYLFYSSSVKDHVAVPYSTTERTLQTFTASNHFGASVQASEVERRTSVFIINAPKFSGVPRLFSGARDNTSPIMLVKISALNAPQLKQTVKVAVAAHPISPYLVMSIIEGPAVSMANPVKYFEHITAMTINPKCGLAIDGQSRVLASVDFAS